MKRTNFFEKLRQRHDVVDIDNGQICLFDGALSLVDPDTAGLKIVRPIGYG